MGLSSILTRDQYIFREATKEKKKGFELLVVAKDGQANIEELLVDKD